jgi:hypothetical protein
MIEREAKLAAGEAFELPDFGGLDLRLARWGLSLRYRAGWGSRTASGQAAFAAGELAALERAAAQRARSRRPRAWKHTKATAPTG